MTPSSMTAFASKKTGGGAHLQIRSVNHRSLKISCRACHPNQERVVKDMIQQYAQRGHIELSATQNDNRVDLENSFRNWREHCKKEELPEPSWSDFFASLSFISTTACLNPEEEQETLQELLISFKQQAEMEGAKLVDYISGYLDEMRKEMENVQTELPRVHNDRVQRFKQKVQCYGTNIEANTKDDLGSQLAVLLEKLDVSEECDRLMMHLEHMTLALKTEHQGGKHLDFLCQEIFREINTLGNKCQDIKISRSVVFLKTQLEKIREQVQNLA